MCFSANASFGLGTVLLIGGATSIKKVFTKEQIPFAVIPLIFAIQQFIEGYVWLSLTNASYASLHQMSTYAFLIIAQVVWPFWVPFSMLLLEKKLKRKKVLTILTVFGSTISVCLACVLWYSEVDSYVNQYHISYYINFPVYFTKFTGILYFIPTVIPAFFSGIRNMLFLGFVLLGSFVVAKLFYSEFVISIWCYFAAGISIIVLYIMMSFSSKEREAFLRKSI